jgi:hypothetical protein
MDTEKFFPDGIDMGETMASLISNIKSEIGKRINRNLNLYFQNELDASINVIISLGPRMLNNILAG